uniref:Alpha-galactosidase n=2 Tax=Phaeomonas parva TaxID=124430 RepID=A0A7S1TPY1_9STRA|mmetsp:Transcript_11500/g.34922  ORF Transcript_11500/g.34922 Transcript_11500/m.34922 type:complete len:373 (+) Transcript_11500:67-1185(+)
MGWRSWNAYGRNISQQRMTRVMDAMVDASRGVSLKDAGYNDVGLDDNYQRCASGIGETPHRGFHNWEVVGDATALTNAIDKTRFPDMKAMTDYAHSLGLRAGFYLNNCLCAERPLPHEHQEDAHYLGDALDVVRYGFDSVKIDNCGPYLDLERYQRLLNETAGDRYISVENCHWGETVPTHTWCPFSTYRTSWDIHMTWTSMFKNLQTMIKFTAKRRPLSRPGCWAYADMLEVGNLHSYEEDRSHFGAWCVTSNPLILGLDLFDSAKLDRVWDIITNPELLRINQEWAGHPGRLVRYTRPTAVSMIELEHFFADGLTREDSFHKESALHIFDDVQVIGTSVKPKMSTKTLTLTLTLALTLTLTLTPRFGLSR